MRRVGSHARVVAVAVIVINQRKTSAQFLLILYFHVQHCQLCFKKVKWTLCYLLLPLPPPSVSNKYTTAHMHAHKHALQTHTHTHAHTES